MLIDFYIKIIECAFDKKYIQCMMETKSALYTQKMSVAQLVKHQI